MANIPEFLTDKKRTKTFGLSDYEKRNLVEKFQKIWPDGNPNIEDLKSWIFELHQKAIENLNPDLSEKTEELQRTIEVLESEKQVLTEKLHTFEEETGDNGAAEELEAVQQENQSLKEQLEAERQKTPDSSQYMRINPNFFPILEDLTHREAKRTGKELSYYDVVWQLFWAQVSKGPGDHFGYVYSRNEISELLDKSGADE